MPRLTVILLIATTVSTTLQVAVVVGEGNVMKREANHDLFPDWVPFKNKHNEELGEFVDVEVKKPKKRLALPMNFVLRALADQPEDYFEKGGNDDSEDYYEKKEWSDANRAAQPNSLPKENHTSISDIDGVVGIITRHQPNVLKPYDKLSIKTEPEDEELDQKKEDETEKKKAEVKTKVKNEKKKNQNKEDYNDDDEETSEKPRLTEEERREAEAKKARILSSVDELKARHALEQRTISEKVKEEAMYKEERERDADSLSDHDKYSQRRHKSDIIYDDYEDRDLNLDDKYKIVTFRPSTTTTRRSRWITKPRKNTTTKKHDAPEPTGKMSVFRNPSIFMIFDDDSSSTSEKPLTTETTTEKWSTIETSVAPNKFSSRYAKDKMKEVSNESDRISLVPDDNELKDGEPTLFFPKKRKSKRKRINNASKARTTSATEPVDLFGSESYQDTAAKESIAVEMPHSGNNETSTAAIKLFEQVPLSSASNVETSSKEVETSPSAESQSSATSASGPTATGASGPTATGVSSPGELENFQRLGELEATGPVANNSSSSAASLPSALSADAEPASSDHEKHEKGGDYEQERGGEKEHHSAHQSTHGSSGKKAYEGHHKDTKSGKGHYEKEDHSGSYDDKGGHDESHHNEKKHYGHHHHEEHGKKHAEYEESGKHSKGHSTKGRHDIHKKDEYEKKVEFFEEDGDSIEEEKHGEHKEEKSHESGGKFHKANHDTGYAGGNKGEAGHFDKTGHSQAFKGHKSSGGHDSHGKFGHQKEASRGNKHGKKWIYHHGVPAKNANLILIDRRTDQLYHGPQYYG